MKPKRDWPRIRNLPESERRPFGKWLEHQTRPWLDDGFVGESTVDTFVRKRFWLGMTACPVEAASSLDEIVHIGGASFFRSQVELAQSVANDINEGIYRHRVSALSIAVQYWAAVAGEEAGLRAALGQQLLMSRVALELARRDGR